MIQCRRPILYMTNSPWGGLSLRGTPTLFSVLFVVFLDDLVLQDPWVGRLPGKRRVAQGYLLGFQYSVASEPPTLACTLQGMHTRACSLPRLAP